MNPYREIILIGFHMWIYEESLRSGSYEFRIEYDPELALAGLPAYYVHRARYKGDGLKNQRTVSELPIPEPAVFVYDPEGTGQNFADVVLASTFDEALAFLGKPYHPHGGDLPLHLLRAEREQIEQDTRVAHADEIAAYENQQPGQMTLLF